MPDLIYDRSAVTGIVLAGGQSKRLGRDKTLERLDGKQTLIERVVGILTQVTEQVLISANDPQKYEFLSLPVISDLIPDRATLGGIHAGLSTMPTEYGLVVAADMPFLNVPLLRWMCSQPRDFDALVPVLGKVQEPTHALYSKACVAAIAQVLSGGTSRVIAFLPLVRSRYIEEADLRRLDPDLHSFDNINEQADVERAKALLGSFETNPQY